MVSAGARSCASYARASCSGPAQRARERSLSRARPQRRPLCVRRRVGFVRADCFRRQRECGGGASMRAAQLCRAVAIARDGSRGAVMPVGCAEPCAVDAKDVTIRHRGCHRQRSGESRRARVPHRRVHRDDGDAGDASGMCAGFAIRAYSGGDVQRRLRSSPSSSSSRSACASALCGVMPTCAATSKRCSPLPRPPRPRRRRRRRRLPRLSPRCALRVR